MRRFYRSIIPPVSNPNPDHPAQDQPIPREHPEMRFDGAHFHRLRLIQWLSQALTKPLLACLENEMLSFVCECLPEIRSFVHRIWFVYKHRPDLHGVDLGQFFEKTSCGIYRVNRRTHACSEDIERFLAARPWLTAIDVLLLAEAWSWGVEWCARNHSER
jgi:hypothetical protein